MSCALMVNVKGFVVVECMHECRWLVARGSLIHHITCPGKIYGIKKIDGTTFRVNEEALLLLLLLLLLVVVRQ